MLATPATGAASRGLPRPVAAAALLRLLVVLLMLPGSTDARVFSPLPSVVYAGETLTVTWDTPLQSFEITDVALFVLKGSTYYPATKSQPLTAGTTSQSFLIPAGLSDAESLEGGYQLGFVDEGVVPAEVQLKTTTFSIVGTNMAYISAVSAGTDILSAADAGSSLDVTLIRGINNRDKFELGFTLGRNAITTFYAQHRFNHFIGPGETHVSLQLPPTLPTSNAYSLRVYVVGANPPETDPCYTLGTDAACSRAWYSEFFAIAADPAACERCAESPPAALAFFSEFLNRGLSPGDSGRVVLHSKTIRDAETCAQACIDLGPTECTAIYVPSPFNDYLEGTTVETCLLWHPGQSGQESPLLVTSNFNSVYELRDCSAVADCQLCSLSTVNPSSDPPVCYECSGDLYLEQQTCLASCSATAIIDTSSKPRACKACPSGQIANANRTACITTAAPTFAPTTAAPTQPPTTGAPTQPPTTSAPTKPPTGAPVIAPTQTPTPPPTTGPCLEGSFQVMPPTQTSDRVCSFCATGTFSNTVNVASCTACQAGTFQDQTGQKGCKPWVIDCAPGEVVSAAPSATADRTCTACLPGSYSDTTNAASCETCVADVDFQPLAGQTDCTAVTASPPCSAGSYIRAGTPTTDRTCTACEAGKVDDDSNPATACVLCNAGTTFQAASGQTTCLPVATCGAGFEQTKAPTASSDRVCSPCDAGKSQPVASPSPTDVCIPCGTGTYAAPGASTCTICAPGKQDADLDPATPCTTCPANTFRASVATSACVAGTACPNTQYESVALTPTSDRQCKNFSAPCPTAADQVTAPTPTSDRVCKGTTISDSSSGGGGIGGLVVPVAAGVIVFIILIIVVVAISHCVRAARNNHNSRHNAVQPVVHAGGGGGGGSNANHAAPAMFQNPLWAGPPAASDPQAYSYAYADLPPAAAVAAVGAKRPSGQAPVEQNYETLDEGALDTGDDLKKNILYVGGDGDGAADKGLKPNLLYAGGEQPTSSATTNPYLMGTGRPDSEYDHVQVDGNDFPGYGDGPGVGADSKNEYAALQRNGDGNDFPGYGDGPGAGAEPSNEYAALQRSGAVPAGKPGWTAPASMPPAEEYAQLDASTRRPQMAVYDHTAPVAGGGSGASLPSHAPAGMYDHLDRTGGVGGAGGLGQVAASSGYDDCQLVGSGVATAAPIGYLDISPTDEQDDGDDEQPEPPRTPVETVEPIGFASLPGGAEDEPTGFGYSSVVLNDSMG